MHPRSFPAALARAWRSLVRRPGAFAIAVSSLAIALGLATAIIAEIDSVQHPYMPVRDPEHLFQLGLIGGGEPRPTTDEARKLLLATPVFTDVVFQSYVFGPLDAGAYIGNTDVLVAEPRLLQVMGLRARIGRLFRADEGQNSGVTVVSDEFWRRYYGNRSAVDSAAMTFNGQTYQIVGVLEHGFSWGGDFILPQTMTARTAYIARAKPEATQADVLNALRSVEVAIRQRYSEGKRPFHFFERSFQPSSLGFGLTHLALIASAVFILAIACANVAALMLARGITRRRDQALQLALGATRRDLLRDVGAEIVILAGIGGAIGVLLALGATGLLRAAMPAGMRWQGFVEPHWNPRVFGLMFLAVMSAIALAAAGPSWYVARIAPAEPLKDGAGSTTGRPRTRFQLLVAMELALSLILLVGASLIARTVAHVRDFDFGYPAREVYEAEAPMRVVPAKHVYALNDPASPQRQGYVELDATDLVAMVDRLRAQPGVRGASWVGREYAVNDVVTSEELNIADSVLFKPRLYNVGPDFLSTLGIPVVRGRDFVDGDRTTTGAVILDERSAQRLFPNGGAVGRLIKLGPPLSKYTPWIPVVGIARNVVHELPEYPELPQPSVIYVSRVLTSFSPSFVVRAKQGATGVARTAIRTIRDALPVRTRVSGGPWTKDYEEFLATRRFVGSIFNVLSVASLLLATAGLFGVLSYVVSQRMREFAVRVALGAGKRNVVRLVLRDSLIMALGGTAIGGLVALGTGGLIAGNWLWGMYDIDAVALVAAEAVLLAVTFSASVLPALRASRANPAEVMRAL